MAAAVVVLVLLVGSATAQLSREEKQELLDGHNFRRAIVRAADMNQIVSGCVLIANE